MSNCMIVRRGSSKKLQSKTVTPSTSQQTITPDSGYDGFESVTVSAITPTKSAQTYTPGTSNQTIASGRWLTGTQTIKGDANLVAANIKKGVSIFGVTGTLTSMSNENAILVVYVGGGGADYTVTVSSTNYTETQGRSDGFEDGAYRLFSLPASGSGNTYYTVQDDHGHSVSNIPLRAGSYQRLDLIDD